MIRNIKLTKYKGIEEISLENLGQLNIFCGRNNSGKTSILESINSNENRSLGLLITEIEKAKLVDSFSRQAGRYSDPSPRNSNAWFSKALDNLTAQKSLWYQSDLKSLQFSFVKEMKNEPNLARRAGNIFDFNEVLFNIFKDEQLKSDDFILIPAKRRIEMSSKINVDDVLTAQGDGLLNSLFFLKNQDTQGNEYKKYQIIQQEFNKISGCYFNIIPIRDNLVKLQFKISESWKDASDCGLGLIDLLIIISNIILGEHTYILIEEPENHIHADFQTKLLSFFKKLVNKQFFISTHSNIFFNSDSIDKLFYCYYDSKVNVSDSTSLSKILDSLGLSIHENITSDALVLVEGPTDVPIVRQVFKLIGAIKDYNIKFWPLGGDIMDQLDLTLFKGRKNIYAIIDSDPKSSSVRKRFMAACKINGVVCLKLERCAIENYIPMNVIRECFPEQIPKNVTSLDFDKLVDEQIGFKSKGKSIKGKNYLMAEKIPIEALTDSDLWNFCNRIFETLKSNFQPEPN